MVRYTQRNAHIHETSYDLQQPMGENGVVGSAPHHTVGMHTSQNGTVKNNHLSNWVHTMSPYSRPLPLERDGRMSYDQISIFKFWIIKSLLGLSQSKTIKEGY